MIRTTEYQMVQRILNGLIANGDLNFTYTVETKEAYPSGRLFPLYEICFN